MNKIKWESNKLDNDMGARVGNLILTCNQWTKAKTVDCRANVSICQIANTRRFGPWRKSMTKAKEDAVRIAHELLEDYQIAIEREVKLLQGMEI